VASRSLLHVSRALVLVAVGIAPFLLTSLPGVPYNVFASTAPTLAQYSAALMIADLLILSAAVCYLVAMGIEGRLSARTDWLDWGPLALIVLMGVSALTSVCKFDSVLEVRRIADCVAIFLLARTLFGGDRLRTVALWVLLLASGAAAVYGVRSYLRSAIVEGAPTWREFGTFGNPNSFAGLLIMAAPVGVALCVVCYRRVREGRGLVPFALAVVSTALVLAALFLTGSKGGFLAFAVAALAAFVLLGWGAKRLRLRTKLVGLLLVLLALGLPLLLPPIRVRLLSAFTTQSHSGGFRWYTWRGTWRMIEAHPWLGTGPGTFVHAYQEYALVGFTRMAHNKDLQVWAECGVFALLALTVALLAYLLTVLVRVRRMEGLSERAVPVALWAGVVAFCLHNLVDWDWYVPALCLTAWFLMGLGVSRDSPPSIPAPEAPARTRTKHDRRPKKRRKAPPATPAPPPPAPSVRLEVRVLYWIAVALAALYLVVFPIRTLASAWALTRAQGLARTVGYLDTAADYARRAARLSPLDARACFELGQIEEVLSRTSGSASDLDDAIAAMERAHQLQPTEARNLYWLALLYSARGDRLRAAEAGRLAHEAAPNDTKVLVTYAQAADAAGLVQEADDAWWELRELWDNPQRPIRRYPAVPDALPDFRYAYAWLHFARAEMAAGNCGEAGRLLARARDLLQEYNRRVARRERMKRQLAAAGLWPPEGLAEERTLGEEAALLVRRLEDCGR
jgi:O-antigen ligase/tetratricopeptide (TPR) repeat protein